MISHNICHSLIFMNNTLIIVGVVVIGAAGLYLFLNRGVAELALETPTVPSDVLTNTQLFMERRAVLESIKLDTQVLSDPRFTALKAFSGPIPPRPVGRGNPFAPTANTGPSS